MPVPKSYYTTPEAIALIRKRWPDEDDPKGALRRLCRDGDVSAWIIDEKTGERVNVPPDRFFGRRQGFRCNLKSGRAMLVRNDPHVLRLNYLPEVYRGELRIGREEFGKLASAADAPVETAANEPPGDVGDKGAANEGDKSPERRAGRPSLKDDIDVAYVKVADEEKIDFTKDMKDCYDLIGQAVPEKRSEPDLKVGLGDDTIRKVITERFNAAKTRAAAKL